MSNAIASAAVVLSANADPMAAGLNKASGDLDKWASKEQAKADKAGSKGGLFGGLLGMGGGKVMGAAMAAGFGAEMIGNGLGTIKELAGIGKQAQSLGIASDQFMGLGAAAKKAGIEGDAFGAMMGKLGGRVSGAASGNAEMAKTFAALGLDAKKLKGLSLDQQFLEVADAISKVPDAGGRAAAAMKLFEEGGLKLLPMLGQGKGKLEEFIAAQKAQGTALGQGDMSGIMKAQAAMPKLEATFKGAWYKIVAAAAPAVEAIGGALGRVWEMAKPAIGLLTGAVSLNFRMIGTGLGFITRAVGRVVDHVEKWAGGVSFLGKLWGFLKDGVEGFFFVAEEVFQVVLGVIDEVCEAVGGWLSGLLNIGTTTGDVGLTVMDVFRGIAVGAGYVWDSIKFGVGAVAAGIGVIIEEFAVLSRTMDEAVGVWDHIPDRFKPEWVKDVREWSKEFNRSMEGAGAKMKGWGEKQMDSFGGSRKDVEKWFDGVEQRWNARGKKKAGPGMDGENVKPPEPVEAKLAGVMERGSKEAYSVIARVTAQGMVDPQDTGAKQLRELQAVKQAVDRAVEAIRNIPAMGVI